MVIDAFLPGPCLNRERLVSSHTTACSFLRDKMINFEPTEYSRKLDTVGRLVIPSKLRKEMRLELGEEYPFYTCVDEHGQSWLCIPCPGVETEVDKAKRILEENGYRFFEG